MPSKKAEILVVRTFRQTPSVHKNSFFLNRWAFSPENWQNDLHINIPQYKKIWADSVMVNLETCEKFVEMTWNDPQGNDLSINEY